MSTCPTCGAQRQDETLEPKGPIISIEEAQALVERLAQHKVTDWESGFLGSFGRMKYGVSAKQAEVLERMRKKYLDKKPAANRATTTTKTSHGSEAQEAAPGAAVTSAADLPKDDFDVPF